jgi:hypothetical protein
LKHGWKVLKLSPDKVIWPEKDFDFPFQVVPVLKDVCLCITSDYFSDVKYGLTSAFYTTMTFFFSTSGSIYV